MKIGSLIQEARKRASMTLTELGELIGASASTLSTVENDQRTAPSIPELVKISDALMDRQLLREFCNACPIRGRIAIQKFKPLNNIVPGVLPAMIKTTQKISLAAEALNSMMTRLCNSNFRQDPEYGTYRNATFLRLIEAMRGLEIVVEQAEAEGLISSEEFLVLKDIHRQQNVAKGHHIETEG